MKKEQDRLFSAEFKEEMRYGRKFHAAVRIQQCWLRKKRKFRIYKNIYQLMDEYSVEGGFTGQDSAKYFGIGRGKNLLKIQEDFMNKVLDHQMAKREILPQKCKEVSKKVIETIFQDAITDNLWNNGSKTIYTPNIFNNIKFRKIHITDAMLRDNLLEKERYKSLEMAPVQVSKILLKDKILHSYEKQIDEEFIELSNGKIIWKNTDSILNNNTASSITTSLNNKELAEDKKVPPPPPSSPCNNNVRKEILPNMWTGKWSKRCGLIPKKLK